MQLKMESLDDDIITALGLLYLLQKKKHKKRPRSEWVNDYLKGRAEKGRFQRDFQDMRDNPKVFKENFHLTPEQFDELLAMIKDRLEPLANTRPDAISPTEKLCVTLEFLASGTFQRHIASCYRISKQRIGPIIENTCRIIYEELQKRFMKPITRNTWVDHANNYHSRWNFPNCLGAIDGKHVAIKCPDNGASCFYNHKGFHSIVLMAVSDSEYKFTFVDIGAYGSEGDSAVFGQSEFGMRLSAHQLDLPTDANVGGNSLPFVFVSDDAFPLHKHILKPYQPNRVNKMLTPEQRVFNYRLSRARRCVENAFGILNARWMCISRTMLVKPDRAQVIVAACCMLHNYMLTKHKDEYSPPGFADYYDEKGQFVEGEWRRVNQIPMQNNLETASQGRPPAAAVVNRDKFCTYFNSSSGKVPWQDIQFQV